MRGCRRVEGRTRPAEGLAGPRRELPRGEQHLSEEEPQRAQLPRRTRARHGGGSGRPGWPQRTNGNAMVPLEPKA